MNRAALAARCCLPLVLLAPFGASLAAPPMSFANYPLFLAPTPTPNVMIIFDNSQSMDATMGGKVISGDDPNTRGNIARGVLRGVLTSYRDAFRWGLTTFGLNNTFLLNTHAYYLGSASTMVYTNDCNAAGVSPSNGGLRCIPNPDAAVNGFSHITYDRTGDDPDINDVLYSSSTANAFYGIGDSGTSYFLRGAPRDTGTAWATANFPTPGPFGAGAIPFTETDAGFLPQVATRPREVFLRRGWGYLGAITGVGNIVETVEDDSAPHFSRLLSLLGSETNNPASGEIKNAATFTPLAGSLKTARDYFASPTQTPISQTCQRNFVMLATDGNPTGKIDGTLYNPSQWINTETSPGVWSFGQAQQDVFAQITALRGTPLGAGTYDIRTYVIGMGETVTNSSSLAALNRMAQLGGAYPTAFTGTDPASLAIAFQAIVGDIQAKASAASSVALNAGSWTAGSALFQAKFNSADWSGNLLALPVAASGAIGATPIWDAGAQIKAQNWDTNRRILTYKPSAAAGARGIAFRWPVDPASPTLTELDVGQTNELNKNPLAVNDGFGAARLNYLRGDASNEARNCATPPCAGAQFRNRRLTPLGDIVNSAPYYVGAPNFGYFDDFEAAPYSSFVSTYRTRTPTIYVGANDGMLHAINAATGVESFAYVPSALYSGLSQLTSPNYAHRYYVDGSPTVGDVFYGGTWHTLLVSGMRAGAKGLFALDVTDPNTFNETSAASIVRWEYQDPDMGHVFGQPLLVRTNNGKWSVIVSGGYNAGNASGRAILFVIDAQTGTLVRKIDTGAGTAASPNGLSAAAAIDTNGDGLADLVYAGDLDGHLWKFSLSGADPAAWAVGNGGAPLFSAGGGQAITSRPDVTKMSNGGYMVGFGTGRYLASADNADATPQAVYGIWDNGSTGTVTLAQLLQQSIIGTGTGVDGNTYRLSTHAVDSGSDYIATGDNAISRASYLATKRGWYVDLPDSGERVVVDARFRGGRVIFTSLIPDVSSACAYGGSGWVLEFDAFTGNRLDTPTFDTNADNALSTADYVSSMNTSGRRFDAITAGAAFMSNRSGGNVGLEDKYFNTSEGNVVRVRETAGAGREGRVMWHEVR